MTEKIEWYREVLKLEPNSKVFFPLARLIELLHDAGRVADCRRQVDELTKLFAAYAGFWRAWAVCLESSGDRSDAGVALRFLALNFISGFLRLWLNEFEDADGRSRLSGAIDYVAKQGVYHQNELLDETVRLANETLNFEQRYTLGEELIRHFAEKTEWCAEALHCPALLNDQYFRLSQRLNHINTLLHEQITRI